MRISPKRINPERINETGFTLIEVIVTLVVGAVLGTIIVTYMGTALTESAIPVLRVQHSNTLGQVVENITANYNKLNSNDLNNGTSVALATLSANINNGHVPASVPYYGPYSIVYKGYIAFDGSGNQISDTSGDNRVLKITLQQGDQIITTLFTR